MLVSDPPPEIEEEIRETHIVDLTLPKRMPGALELLVIGLVVLTLGAVGTIAAVNLTSTSEDDTVKSQLRDAKAAMAKYQADHGSYAGVTTAELRKSHPTVPANFATPVVAGGTYRLSLTTADGVTYILARSDRGAESRTCVAAPDGATGDCKVKELGIGTW
jgi:type II secretory pathway pseudopilin PulG